MVWQAIRIRQNLSELLDKEAYLFCVDGNYGVHTAVLSVAGAPEGQIRIAHSAFFN